MKTNNYKTVQDFLSDVKLLFDNINVFYSPSSDEFKAAVNLKSVFHNHLAEFGFCHRTGSISPVSSLTLRIPKVQLPSLRSPRPLTRSQRMSSSSESSVSTNKSTPTTSKPPPAKSSSGGKASAKGTRSRAWIDEYLGSDDPFKMYLAQVYNHHDSSGDYVAELFHSLPSRKEYPEYYRVISEPIDLSTIKKKIDVSQPTRKISCVNINAQTFAACYMYLCARLWSIFNFRAKFSEHSLSRSVIVSI